jgi:hypothetical protein
MSSYAKINASVFWQKIAIKEQRKSWLSLDCVKIRFVLFYSLPYCNMTLKHVLNKLYVFNFLLVTKVNSEALVLIVYSFSI